MIIGINMRTINKSHPEYGEVGRFFWQFKNIIIHFQTVVTKTKAPPKPKTYKSLIRLYFEDFVS